MIFKKFYIALLLILICQKSFAGNSNSFFLGDDASLAAGAIAAVTRDSESVWYNPAGLGGNVYSRLDLSGNVLMIRLQKIPKGMQVILPSGQTNKDMTGNEFLAVPAAMTFTRKATDDVSFGFGVYVPQYQDLSINTSMESVENFPGIAEPITYKQSFDVDDQVMQYHLGGAVGWQINPRIRIGGSLFFLYGRQKANENQFESIQSADGSLTTSLFYVDNARILLRTVGVRAVGGAQFDISPQWKAGIVLFSPTLQIASWGEATAGFAGVGSDSQGREVKVATRATRSIKEWDWDMVEPFHPQISFGFVRPDFWIGFVADFYLPLKNPNLLVDKKFNWNVCLGSKFKVTEKLYMGAGFFTDMSDNPSPNAFGGGQINYYGLTYGLQFRTPIKRDNEDKPPMVFSTTFAGRYALGLGKVGGQLFDPVTDENLSTARVNEVDARFQELSVYIGTSLLF